jgi:acylphosphatase
LPSNFCKKVLTGDDSVEPRVEKPGRPPFWRRKTLLREGGSGFITASNLACLRVFPQNAGFGGAPMTRSRMHILYSGRVQGVGFRYTTKSVAMGFEVTGAVRNLPDGRVELTVEGERAELEAFQEAVRDSGLAGFIRDETVDWATATGEFKGFEIVR